MTMTTQSTTRMRMMITAAPPTAPPTTAMSTVLLIVSAVPVGVAIPDMCMCEKRLAVDYFKLTRSGGLCCTVFVAR